MVTIANCNHHYNIVPYAPPKKKSRHTSRGVGSVARIRLS